MTKTCERWATQGMWEMLSDILAEYDEKLPQSLNDTIYALRDGRAEVVSAWIKCSERMPLPPAPAQERVPCQDIEMNDETLESAIVSLQSGLEAVLAELDGAVLALKNIAFYAREAQDNVPLHMQYDDLALYAEEAVVAIEKGWKNDHQFRPYGQEDTPLTEKEPPSSVR